jgi:hypothetical protein
MSTCLRDVAPFRMARPFRSCLNLSTIAPLDLESCSFGWTPAWRIPRAGHYDAKS